MAGFISNKPASKKMREEAASAGTYTHKQSKNDYPRIQLLTIAEMLEEKKAFDTPTKLGSKIATGQIHLGLK